MDDLGLRASDVARKCDVPDSTVARWLSGSLPRDSKLAVVARTIDTPLDVIVEMVARQRLAAQEQRPARASKKTQAERLAELEAAFADMQRLLTSQNETLEMLQAAIISKTRQLTSPRRSR
jgi:hypothetical protein